MLEGCRHRRRAKISGAEGAALDKTISLTVSESPEALSRNYWLTLLRRISATVLFGLFACTSLYGQDSDSDPEAYKFRIVGQFWYATPIVTVSGSSSEGQISFDKDF